MEGQNRKLRPSPLKSDNLTGQDRSANKFKGRQGYCLPDNTFIKLSQTPQQIAKFVRQIIVRANDQSRKKQMQLCHQVRVVTQVHTDRCHPLAFQALQVERG